MSKFTPGKWRARPSKYGGEIHIDDTNGKAIAAIHRMKEDGEQEANAHLIASAPDLLEACKMFLTLVTEQQLFSGAALVKAKDAIAKAEGKDA
jgi:hypothetical protein